MHGVNKHELLTGNYLILMASNSDRARIVGSNFDRVRIVVVGDAGESNQPVSGSGDYDLSVYCVSRTINQARCYCGGKYRRIYR